MIETCTHCDPRRNMSSAIYGCPCQCHVTDSSERTPDLARTSPPDYKQEIEEILYSYNITVNGGDTRDAFIKATTKLTHLIETEKKKADSMNEIANMVARHKEVDFVFNGKTYHIKELQGEVE